MNTFTRTQSRTDVVSIITGGSYRSSLPHFGPRYRHKGEDDCFAKRHFVFQKGIFEGTLELQSAPRFLDWMLEYGHAFDVGKQQAIVVSRDDLENDQLQSRICKFVRRIYGKDTEEFAKDIRRQPICIFSEYSKSDPRGSHLSGVWDQSIKISLIPYDVIARREVLKAGAPISEFAPATETFRG